MRVLVLNPRSGSGKTTTALNLSLGLAREGVSVQVVDLDPRQRLLGALSQSIVSSGSSDGRIEGQESVDGLSEAYPSLKVSARDVADFASHDLAEPISPNSDLWQILDTPSDTAGSHTALISASDLVLVPIKPEPADLDGLVTLVSELQAHGMPSKALRILVAQYSNRILGHRIARSKLIERFGSQAIAPVVIRTSSRLSTAGSTKRSVFLDAPRSTGASDYSQLARSFLSERALWNAN